MMKHMKKIISFLLAVCMLTGTGLTVPETTTSVSMSDWVEVPSVAEEAGPKDPFIPKAMISYLANNTLNRAYAADPTPTPNVAAGQKVGFMDPNTNNEFVKDGNAPIQFSNSLTLVINGKDADGKPCPISQNVTISDAISTQAGIVEVQSGGYIEGGQKYQVVITALAPGQTQIVAHVTDKDNGTSYNITCNVQVKLEIDKSDTLHWLSVTNDKKVLVLNQAEEYQIKLNGIKDKTGYPGQVIWDWPNEGVIELDEATGIIRPKGAGVAKVMMKPLTGTQKAEEFTVIVSPVGTEDHNDSFSEYGQEVKFSTSSDSFSLYTNGNPASNMTWEVYKLTYNSSTATRTKIDQKDTSLLTYVVDESSGNINFSGVKAGTYEVIGYASTDKLYAEQGWNKVTFKITVNMTLQDTVRYLNVGDTFSIMGNSNVPEARFSELLEIDYKDAANGSYVAALDSKVGLLTALNDGMVEVTVKYRQAPQDSIYKPGDPNRSIVATYTFYVIDEMSLNTTSLNMYTGSTYQLIANTTDRTAPVTWETSDPKVAEVDQNGLVTAKKATGTTPVIITAYQIISGVKKAVTCTIFIEPAVTNVTLNPDNVIIDIGEYETIKAAVKPAGITGTSLHWLSSDPSIFQITDSTDLTVTILGKTGGTAVLTALNAENIVVGYCKVTVSQPAQSIKLSQTELTVPLAQKTYQLYATLSPENTTNKNVIWDTQNAKIATVDKATGLVTFKNAGTVTISVQSVDNPLLIAYCTFNIERAVAGIELDTHDVELYSGETRRLSYQLFPNNAANPEVIWTSFDTSIVTVDDTGLLTAKGPGSTQIMVMSAEDGSCYDICTVVVYQKATSVKMNYTELTMDRGEYFDMEVTITPISSTEAALIWESLNPKVATVSSTGRITARAEGTAIIAVRTQSGVTSYCTVNVLEPVISLELDPTDLIIDVGEIFKIDPVFKPAAPTIQDVKWTSYNKEVATVNALGEVEGISRGSTIVTCETVDGGYRAFCLVQVIDPALQITITPDNYRLGYGKTVLLETKVTNHGEEVKNMPIIWESSDESVCTVDETGRVTGENYGYATIRAEIDDEYGAFATCEIRVVREVTSIRLNHSVLTVIQGHTVSLKADVQPSNATYTDASFSSDDEKIAAVDEDGMITGIKPGSTWVWAKAKDNSGKYARCYVTVIEPVPATGITVSDKQVVLIANESKKLVFTMKPNNTTDDLTWSSANEAIATVDGSGIITAHRTGSTTVTGLTTSGKTTSVEVIVIGLNKTSVEMALYDDRVTLYVDGATTGIKWDSDNSSIVEVNNGKLTSRKVGTTYVTATVNGRRLRCKVTVLPNEKN